MGQAAVGAEEARRGEAGDAVGGVVPVGGAVAGGGEDGGRVVGEVAGEERGFLAGVDQAAADDVDLAAVPG